MNFFAPAYIDPGTGSMLFTILIGILATVMYALRGLKIKLKYLLGGGQSAGQSGDRIPYVIYSDSKRYWNVFKPICDEFERRQVPLTYLTQSEDDPVFGAGYKYITAEFIGAGNKAFARLNVLKAGTVISTTPGLDVYQWKRSKDVDRYIHVFHDATEGTGYRMFGIDFYDDILLTGEFQERYLRKLEELRDLPAKRMYVTGSLYLDAMERQREALEAARGEADVQEAPAAGAGEAAAADEAPAAMTGGAAARTVLLAPSWGESSILNRFGEQILDALIATGYDIAVRPHPQMKTSDPELLDALMKKYPDGEHFAWNFDNDNFDILSRSDIMITDFSGVMLDYALIFDRPLVYADTDLDLSPYDAAWIDETVWRLQILPLLGRRLDEADFPRMKEVLDGVMSNDVYREGREQVRETAWQYRGEAAVRTVDYILGAEK